MSLQRVGKIKSGDAVVFLLSDLSWESGNDKSGIEAEIANGLFLESEARHTIADPVDFVLTRAIEALGDGWQSERLTPPEPADPEKIY